MSRALNTAIQSAVALNADSNVKFIDIQANGLLDGINVTKVAAVSSDPVNDEWWDLWRDTVGWRAKFFHPQVPYHSAIREFVLNHFLEDTRPATKGNGTCVPVGGTFDP